MMHATFVQLSEPGGEKCRQCCPRFIKTRPDHKYIAISNGYVFMHFESLRRGTAKRAQVRREKFEAGSKKRPTPERLRLSWQVSSFLNEKARHID